MRLYLRYVTAPRALGVWLSADQRGERRGGVEENSRLGDFDHWNMRQDLGWSQRCPKRRHVVKWAFGVSAQRGPMLFGYRNPRTENSLQLPSLQYFGSHHLNCRISNSHFPKRSNPSCHSDLPSPNWATSSSHPIE